MKQGIRRITSKSLTRLSEVDPDTDGLINEDDLKNRKLTIAEQTNRDKVIDQCELVNNDFKNLKVGCDTYSMCFKALHRQSAVAMRLIPNDW